MNKTRVFLFFLSIIIVPLTGFYLKNFGISFNQYIHRKEFKKEEVKIDSIDIVNYRSGKGGNYNYLIIYYNNFNSTIEIDWHENNHDFKRFLKSKKDSMYIWKNPKALDIYTYKEETTVNVSVFQKIIILNFILICFSVFLITWLIKTFFLDYFKSKFSKFL